MEVGFAKILIKINFIINSEDYLSVKVSSIIRSLPEVFL